MTVVFGTRLPLLRHILGDLRSPLGLSFFICITGRQRSGVREPQCSRSGWAEMPGPSSLIPRRVRGQARHGEAHADRGRAGSRLGGGALAGQPEGRFPALLRRDCGGRPLAAVGCPLLQPVRPTPAPSAAQPPSVAGCPRRPATVCWGGPGFEDRGLNVQPQTREGAGRSKGSGAQLGLQLLGGGVCGTDLWGQGGAS